MSPASPQAARLAGLFWWMAGGAILIWIGIVALALYGARGARLRIDDRSAHGSSSSAG